MSRAATHATLRTVDDAVAFVREQERSGTKEWEGRCLSLVAHAYGYAGSGTTDLDRDGNNEAFEYWMGSSFKHRRDRKPPVGALACFRKEGRAGHIAVVVKSNGPEVILLGNDDADGGRVRPQPIKFFEQTFGQTYVGWAEPDFPNGARGDGIPLPRPATPVAVFRQALFLGSQHSESVRTLQRRLNALLGTSLEVSGEYTPGTRDAVREYQRRCGFRGADADGLLFDPATKTGGEVTLRTLFPAEAFVVRGQSVPKSDTREEDPSELGETPDPPETGGAETPEQHGTVGRTTSPTSPTKQKVRLADLEPGKTNRSVRLLQQRLNTVINARLTTTGTYDESTQNAVRAWQILIGDLDTSDGILGPRQFQRLFPMRLFDRVDGPAVARPGHPDTGPDTGLEPEQLTLSSQGEDFIVEFEGFRSKLYEDQAGHCSIGVGHLVHLGPCNAGDRREFRDGITRARAIELMRDDASSKIDTVASNVNVPLTQEQFDALVSFTYNVGESAFEESTLLSKLNQGDFDAVPRQLARWNKVTINGEKVVSRGLTRRRSREATLFSTGSYTG